MTQTSLSKILAIMDRERGAILKMRRLTVKGEPLRQHYNYQLNMLNRLKKEFSDLLDTDEPTLGM